MIILEGHEDMPSTKRDGTDGECAKGGETRRRHPVEIVRAAGILISVIAGCCVVER